jgi:hypothetical protein
MAVTLGLMPTTGLTLPFMSYGRSSQVMSLAATGILINVGRLRWRPPDAARRTSGQAARQSGSHARVSGAHSRVSGAHTARG